MKVEVIENNKGILEIEFDDKILPNALLSGLLKNKVDAYTHGPHPLMSQYILHIEAKNPVKELQSVLKTVEGEWNEFGRELQDKLKPVKKKR